MNKKAQLGFIELKFFLIGLVVGLILAGVAVFLMKNGTLPGIGMVCN